MITYRINRYIGVLNVTFQKQPRRKSTMRKDDFALEPVQTESRSNGTAADETSQKTPEPQHTRVISQSIHNNQGQIPTVTFVDNQHILPRNFLQALPTSPVLGSRARSASEAPQATEWDKKEPLVTAAQHAIRPGLQERHAHSWGATTVNKKLRNEVFNDAFLKQPIAIHRHRKGHRRPLPRRTLQQTLRPTSFDATLINTCEECSPQVTPKPIKVNGNHLGQSQSDLGQHVSYADNEDEAPKDVTGTSAPEPEILGGSSPAALKKKRRYSGTGLRRKPDDVRDDRGSLKYFEEADGIGHKEPREAIMPKSIRKPEESEQSELSRLVTNGSGDGQQDADVSAFTSAENSRLHSPSAEFKKILRPPNPKEAQTQRDSRVEYFLLLEDLTAGMKRPCIMDLKMGTRQYGVDANLKKQKSQQGKCAKTTSRELGVRVCGLQVWDVKTQSYVFKDKYYGRELKKGHEFQSALTRFLYDGVDPSSILRHIPTVLRKLDELEVIIKRLNGYRFYAASLLMFYDGDDSYPLENDAQNGHYIEDSTTDFCTDTEEAPRRAGGAAARRSKKREIDFKIADFANCITPMDSMEDKACPPRHPDEADKGFVRGLRSLRMYFLRIQRDTREEMGLVSRGNRDYGIDELEENGADEGSVSE